jgi:PAS domain S-box-containing protein
MAETDENEHLKDIELSEKKLTIQNQITFAAELFQTDITIRTLLESLAQGVIIVDNQGVILLVNASAELMFGYKSSDIIGKNHNILLPKRLHKIHTEHMESYFKDPRVRPMGKGLSLVGAKFDGTEFPIEISLSFVNIKNVLLVISLISDITLRAGIENSLKNHLKELADANSALESFSYSVSHDLRAPLASMIGFSQVLKEDYAEKIDETGQSYLNIIISSGNKMSQLISDILNLSKIAKQEITWQECDLGEIAKSIIDDLRKDYPSRNIEIIIHQNLKAKGDPKLLQIALSNLLNNAWKFTGKANAPRIEFGEIWQENKKTFFIRDNGVGFKKDTERMFKPFQRMHSDKEFPGTGIGLAIVDRVITRHKGKIWAESTPGSGSIFYFTLADPFLKLDHK